MSIRLSTRSRAIGIIAASLFVAGGGVAFVATQDRGIELPRVFTAPWERAARTSATALVGGMSADTKDAETYTNEHYGFSFTHPAGLSIGSFEQGAGDVILAQSTTDTAAHKESFQIYVAPFDEPGPITPERIKKDLPSLRVEEPKLVVIGGGLEALIFTGQSEDFGESREVWFVHGGHLYQITTHAGQDNFIGPILETWRFNSAEI